jgi:hypothetical protein
VKPIHNYAFLREKPPTIGSVGTTWRFKIHRRNYGKNPNNTNRHEARGPDYPSFGCDRSKQFYQRLGWRLDDDVAPLEGLRIVQFTPPGSGCSVTFGKGLASAAPGSAEGGLVVSGIEAAHDELVGRGIDASDVWHGPPFPVEARQPGPDPKRTSYGSFFSFDDPDGNAWLVQEVTTRAPGRV